MGGQYLWCLLALITIQPWFASPSSSSCAGYLRKLAMLFCDGYTCRNKCNMTVNALLRNGTQQWCHCDEKCVLYQDCCRDFVSVCNAIFQEGTRKYPKFTSSCHSGGIVVVNGVNGRQGTTAKTTAISTYVSSTTEETTTNIVQNKNFLNQVEAPSWAKELCFISQTTIDYVHGLMFSPWISPDGEWLTETYTSTPIQVLSASLEVKRPFSHIEYLHESNKYISVRSLGSPIPKNVKRECLNHFYTCPNCTQFLLPGDYCQTHKRSLHRQTLISRNDTNHELCGLHFFHENHRYKIEPSVSVHQLEVTVSSDSNLGKSTILSNDLPWANIQCKGIPFTLCEIQSCAVDRLFSTDRRACFIPARVSVQVTKRVKPAKGADELNAALHSQNETKNQKMFQDDACHFKHSTPSDLCLALYRLLHRHTGWTFETFSSGQTCRNYLQFRSTSNTDKINTSLETSERVGLDNATSGSFISEGFASDSHQDNIHASQTNNNDDATSTPRRNTGILISYEDQVQQAWKVIHNNLDTLPITDDILSVEICLESEPKFPSNMDEDPEACGDWMSRCRFYKRPHSQSTLRARSLHSSHVHLSWSWWIIFIFILDVFVVLLEDLL